MFDEDYFKGANKRTLPPYTLEKIYPRMLNIAQYFKSKYRPKNILDVGCAKGFLLKAFLDLGIDAKGLDISSYALENAHPATRGKLLLASAEKLPFPNETFDFVFAVDLIEHLKNADKFILEANRVLVKKGRMCIFTVGVKNPNAPKDVTHINVQSASYWHKLFKKCGFKYKRLYYQVGYPHIQNAPYNISKKFKIQKLVQLFAIMKLNFEILRKQEYTFLLTKIKDVEP